MTEDEIVASFAKKIRKEDLPMPLENVENKSEDGSPEERPNKSKDQSPEEFPNKSEDGSPKERPGRNQDSFVKVKDDDGK